MLAWKGWTAASDTAVSAAVTWDEWRTHQQRMLGSENRQPLTQREDVVFSERELARLSFVRWLYQTGRLNVARDENYDEQSGRES
jgi:hypothetical protein